MPVRFFISKELTPSQEEKLRERGVEFLGAPLIKTVPLEFNLKEVLNFSPQYLIFSSKNGVRHFFSKVSPPIFKGSEFISVGSATAKELERLGISPLVPKNFSGEGLIELLSSLNLKGKRFLLVRPKRARSVVREFIEKEGGEVLEVVAYETVKREEAREKVLSFFSKEVDFVAFTSPSNFRAFLELFGLELLKGVKVIPIGHITYEAIRKKGINPLGYPETYTVDAIIDKLLSLV
ncbi:uroporphyrinogen-III synthase [Thermovibrio sp.]